MILPDWKVKKKVEKGQITIDPYFGEFQGPNCYHCHLGTNFLIPKKSAGIADPLSGKNSEKLFKKVQTKKPIILKPKEFLLCETFEFFGVEKGHVIRLLNSSSLARFGIFQAALGMINSGCGTKKPIRLTLELTNNFPLPIRLTPTTIKGNKIKWGTEVLKIAVERMESKPKNNYDSWSEGVYSGDQMPTASKMAGRFKIAENKELPANSLAKGDLNGN